MELTYDKSMSATSVDGRARFWVRFWLAMALSVAIGGYFYAAFHRQHPEWDTLNLCNTALSCTMGAFTVIAAWLFVKSVRNFKLEMRLAYRLLCIGIVLLGVAQAQFAVATYLNATFWYLDGFITLPYLLSVLFVFLGTQRFATLLQVRTKWASLPWVIGSSVIIGIAVGFLPKAPSSFSALQLSVNDGLIALDCVFFVFVVATIARIKQAIGPLYVRAMQWLFAGMLAFLVSGMHYLIVNLLIPRNSNWYFFDSMTTPPFVLSALLLIGAGYAMLSLQLVPTARPVANPQDLPLVDMIVYIAGLASAPRQLDTILDPMRSVTANLAPGRPLSGKDISQLARVYRDVEQYLTTSEPIRPFSAADIRLMLVQHFALDQVSQSMLWGAPLPPTTPA